MLWCRIMIKYIETHFWYRRICSRKWLNGTTKNLWLQCFPYLSVVLKIFHEGFFSVLEKAWQSFASLIFMLTWVLRWVNKKNRIMWIRNMHILLLWNIKQNVFSSFASEFVMKGCGKTLLGFHPNFWNIVWGIVKQWNVGLSG